MSDKENFSDADKDEFDDGEDMNEGEDMVINNFSKYNIGGYSGGRRGREGEGPWGPNSKKKE